MPGRLPQQLDAAGTITPSTDQLIIAQGASDVRRTTVSALLTAAGAIGTWQTWAFPFVSGVTIGNGVWSGRYRDTVTEVSLQGKLLLGSTTSITANILFQAPTSLAIESLINVACLDVSAGLGYNGFAQPNIGSAQSFILGPNGGVWNNLVPFTWATSDAIWISGTYPKP